MGAHREKGNSTLEFLQHSRGRNDTRRPVDAAVEAVLSQLHVLKVDWAEDPPYPDLSMRECIDKLRYIANRLEWDEAANARSAPVDDVGEKELLRGGIRRALTPDPTAATTQDSRERLSALDSSVPLPSTAIANRLGLDAEALRARLARYRKKHFDCFIEVENPRPGQPTILYHVGPIRHVLEEALASAQRTAK